ncbi:MAG: sensor histidine kinase [Limisphaerales bacterium]
MAASQTAKPLPWSSSSVPGSRTDSSVFHRLSPISVTVLSIAAAFGLDLAVGTFATEATDALYIMAAAASAYAGGWRFGFLSVALGMLPNVGLFNSPHYSLAIGVYGWEHVLVTSIIAAVLAALVGRLRKEQNALKTLNNELELRVSVRTAELEESNRQLEAFCHTLAHDLRAPLRAIQGFSQIALADHGEKIGETGLQNLTRIGSSAEMMGRLIHDLLSYTQLDRTEIALTKINLQEVVDRVLQILAPEIQVKNATIQIVRPLPHVRGDFVLLEQILLNLTSNALKFSRDNVPPQIRIWGEQRNQTVRLSIQDNGIGIPAEYVDEVCLFAPFQRLETRSKYPGTGMGLAIAKKSIERLGGRIGVESQQTHGSHFWIELPK